MAELSKENEIKMPIVKVGNLQINTYDFLAEQRQIEVANLKKLEKTKENYKAIKDGKNSLVKKRTDIVKLVKADCGVLDDVKNMIKLKGQSLIEITEPTEKDLASFIDEIDNEEKAKIKAEEERKDAVRQAISDYKQDSIAKINKLKKSDEKIDLFLPEIDFAEFKDLAEQTKEDVIKACMAKKAELKEREDFEVEKERLAREKAELEKQKVELEREKQRQADAEKAKLEASKPKVETKPFEKQVAEIKSDIDDLPPLEELPAIDELDSKDQVPAEEAEIAKALDELDALMKNPEDDLFRPGLKEIYNHLHKTYPVLHGDKYFQALGDLV